jgi:hypothetical protein
MGKFEKGNTLGKGRPIGALNRSTEQVKLTIARAANRALDTLSTDIERLKETNPEKALELSLKLLEYVAPKLKSIEMRAEIEARVQQISININRTGSKDELNY